MDLVARNTKKNFILKMFSLCQHLKNDFWIIFFSFSYLYIVTQSGYTGDDIYNSMLPGILKEQNISAFDFANVYINDWFKLGRVFPLAWYWHMLIWAGIPSIFLYKIFLIVLTTVCTLLTGVFAQLLLQSGAGTRHIVSLFAVICLPLYIPFDSALTSYQGLFQLVYIFGLLCFISTILSLDNKNKYFNFLSTLFLFMALLIYEVAYLYIFILVVIVFFRKLKIKDAIFFLLPQLVVFFTILIVTLVVRINLPKIGYDGLTVSLNFKAIAKTFFYQLSGAFPGVTYFANNNIDIVNIFYDINYFDIVLVGLFLFVLFNLFRQNSFVNYKWGGVGEARIPYVSLFLVGSILLFGVAAIYSLSLKMQNTLTFGIAYCSVLLESYGLVLMFFSIIYLVFKYTNKYLKLVIIGLFSSYCIFIIIVTQQATRQRVQSTDFVSPYSRKDLILSVQNGMLTGLPADSLIVLDTQYSYELDTSPLLSMYNDKPMNRIARTSYINKVHANNSKLQVYFPDTPMYMSKYFSTEKFGIVIVAKIKSYVVGSSELGKYIQNILTDDIKLYYKAYNGSPLYHINGMFYNKINSDTGIVEKDNLLFREMSYKIVGDSEKNSQIVYELKNIPIDFDSIGFGYLPNNESKWFFQSHANNSLQPQRLNNEQNIIHYRIDSDIYFDKHDQPIGIVDVNLFPNIITGNNYTVELLVNPEKIQNMPNAHLIGNHNAYKGFVIQYSNDGNKFYFSYGNGTRWEDNVYFQLQPDQTNYLVVVVKNNYVSIYIDGKLVAEQQNTDSMVQGEIPLTVGDFINKTRKFDGEIYEFAISNISLTPNDVQLRWNEIVK